jgi:preprotein translocase subunit SecG
MSIWYIVLTLLFIIVAAAMILIILVQRSQGGGLAGAFGGAGGSGTDTLFGGRVGDALTWATVVAFVVYLILAVALQKMPVSPSATAAQPQPAQVEGDVGDTPAPGTGDTAPAAEGSITPVPVSDPTGGAYDPTEGDN